MFLQISKQHNMSNLSISYVQKILISMKLTSKYMKQKLNLQQLLVNITKIAANLLKKQHFRSTREKGCNERVCNVLTRYNSHDDVVAN